VREGFGTKLPPTALAGAKQSHFCRVYSLRKLLDASHFQLTGTFPAYNAE
jgi:hypothetical protein